MNHLRQCFPHFETCNNYESDPDDLTIELKAVRSRFYADIFAKIFCENISKNITLNPDDGQGGREAEERDSKRGRQQQHHHRRRLESSAAEITVPRTGQESIQFFPRRDLSTHFYVVAF
jgi:hypothetical protein